MWPPGFMAEDPSRGRASTIVVQGPRATARPRIEPSRKSGSSAVGSNEPPGASPSPAVEGGVRWGRPGTRSAPLYTGCPWALTRPTARLRRTADRREANWPRPGRGPVSSLPAEFGGGPGFWNRGRQSLADRELCHRGRFRGDPWNDWKLRQSFHHPGPPPGIPRDKSRIVNSNQL
jgi:hypothetical protein